VSDDASFSPVSSVLVSPESFSPVEVRKRKLETINRAPGQKLMMSMIKKGYVLVK
jgi:hypothetical protein